MKYDDDFLEMPTDEDEPVYNCPDCGDELTFVGYQGNTIEYKCPVCGKYFYDDNGELLSADEYDDKYYEAEDESLTEARINPLKEISQRLRDDLELYKGEDMFDFEMELPEKYRDKVSDIMRDAEGIRDYSIQEVKEFTDNNGNPYVYVYMHIYPGVNESLNEAFEYMLDPGFEDFLVSKGIDPDDTDDMSDEELDKLGAEFQSTKQDKSSFYDYMSDQFGDDDRWEENPDVEEYYRAEYERKFGESLTEAKNETLNQAIWDENNELKPEVKETLTKIADTFLKKLAEDDIPLDVEDIEIVGSNANYNYTPQSDIDLHIIADLSQFKGREKELAEKIYQCKKSLFNDKYDPTIRGFEVEIYVEPAEDKNDNDIPDEVEEPSEETLGNEEVVEESLNENSINGIGYNDSSDPLGDYYDSLRTKHAPSAKFNKRSKEDQALCNKYQQEYRSASNQWNVSDEDQERAWDMARNKYRYMFDTQLVFAKVMEETGDKNFAATVADMVDLLHEQ